MIVLMSTVLQGYIPGTEGSERAYDVLIEPTELVQLGREQLHPQALLAHQSR